MSLLILLAVNCQLYARQFQANNSTSDEISVDESEINATMRSDFQNPPDKYRPFFGGSVNSAINQIEQIVESGYAGPSIGVRGNAFTDQWYATYRQALDILKENGKVAIMYDDTGFPSGTGMNRIQVSRG